MRASVGVRLTGVLVFIAVAGCGAVADSSSASSDAGADGGADGAAGNDGGRPGRGPDLDLDAGSLPEAPRCDGGAISSPNGGACDSSRLVVVHRGAGGTCVAVGQFCDTLRLFITEADLPKVPPGYTCEPPSQGYVSCAWPLPQSRVVDSAALDGACAATVALPNVRVECIIYD